jgi:hypothetical protein
MPQARKRSSKREVTAAARLFKAAFGREMTAEERKRFIWEKPLSLEELRQRQRRESYDFLRHT